VPALSAADPEPAPVLGEHSVDVLAGTGYSPAEIDALVQQGIVHVPDPGSCP
jgi:crotonobetainyl-CoA:carnitine CoA-transferase CaiB-like acyl-CoA transferase